MVGDVVSRSKWFISKRTIDLSGRGRDREMDVLNGEACHLKIQIVHLKESGINLFGRGRDWGMDFLNNEWCRLKFQIVHIKES